jgi:Tol biopolymer transport system component
MNADGSNIRNLTDGTGGLSPVWSPDGQHIVFTSMRRNARSELFIMDRDGANPHSLLENKATSENASWVR